MDLGNGRRKRAGNDTKFSISRTRIPIRINFVNVDLVEYVVRDPEKYDALVNHYPL